MRITITLFLILTGVGLFSEKSLADEPRRGRYKATFKERSPHSMQAVYKKRCKGDYEFRNETDDNYDITQESFEVYVPQSYDPAKPAGIMVWCPAGGSSAPHQGFIAVCNKHNMLYVGANKASNGRKPSWYRIGFALDAVHNMQKMYNIDKHRIYVSGISGGGSRALLACLSYPDVFSGAFIIAAPFSVTSYQAGDIKRKGWEILKPSAKVWKECEARQRLVYLAGSKDNLCGPENIEGVAKTGYPGFKYQPGYLLVPGLGHAMPGSEWFDKAVLIMDKPLAEVRNLPDVRISTGKPTSAKSRPAQKKKLTVRDNRELRTWTSISGKTINASLLQESGSQIVLKKKDGSKIRISKYKLSKPDRAYIEELKARGE